MDCKSKNHSSPYNQMFVSAVGFVSLKRSQLCVSDFQQLFVLCLQTAGEQSLDLCSLTQIRAK